MATTPGGTETLFVYGSLLESGVRRRLLGCEVAILPARLPGYERRKARYFYVQERSGAETSGLLLMGLAGTQLEIIDVYEEVPLLYQRRRAQVIADGRGAVQAWVYIPTERLLSSG